VPISGGLAQAPSPRCPVSKMCLSPSPQTVRAVGRASRAGPFGTILKRSSSPRPACRPKSRQTRGGDSPRRANTSATGIAAYRNVGQTFLSAVTSERSLTHILNHQVRKNTKDFRPCPWCLGALVFGRRIRAYLRASVSGYPRQRVGGCFRSSSKVQASHAHHLAMLETNTSWMPPTQSRFPSRSRSARL
jgi:hypothetical protein